MPASIPAVTAGQEQWYGQPIPAATRREHRQDRRDDRVSCRRREPPLPRDQRRQPRSRRRAWWIRSLGGALAGHGWGSEGPPTASRVAPGMEHCASTPAVRRVSVDGSEARDVRRAGRASSKGRARRQACGLVVAAAGQGGHGVLVQGILVGPVSENRGLFVAARAHRRTMPARSRQLPVLSRLDVQMPPDPPLEVRDQSRT